MGGMIELLITN